MSVIFLVTGDAYVNKKLLTCPNGHKHHHSARCHGNRAREGREEDRGSNLD